jgi:hypothetical protein
MIFHLNEQVTRLSMEKDAPVPCAVERAGHQHGSDRRHEIGARGLVGQDLLAEALTDRCGHWICVRQHAFASANRASETHAQTLSKRPGSALRFLIPGHDALVFATSRRLGHDHRYS